MNDQQKTARRPGFAATFAGAARGYRTGGDDGGRPRLSRRLLMITAVTVAVAAIVLGAGFVTARQAKKTPVRAGATPAVSSVAAPGTVAAAPQPSAPLVTRGAGTLGDGPAPVNGVVPPAGAAAPAPAPALTVPVKKPAVTGKPAQRTKDSAKAAGGSTSTIVSYSSGRCLDLTDGGGDGTHLQIWDCNGSTQQQWTFTGGTVRSRGLCIDATGASTANGTTVQVATCNGGWTQQWTVNSSHDLVNTAKGKCADLTDNGSGNGTRLQLWDCGGTSNQKFHRV